MDARYSDPAKESFVDASFVIEHKLAVSVFEFDSNLIMCFQIDPLYGQAPLPV
jgi:hypothetical protein